MGGAQRLSTDPALIGFAVFLSRPSTHRPMSRGRKRTLARGSDCDGCEPPLPIKEV